VPTAAPGASERDIGSRTVILWISTAIVALTIGLAVKSIGTSTRMTGGRLQVDRPGISVFGSIHPKLFDLPRPVGSEIPAHPNVRMASLGVQSRGRNLD
jgi:hypothetical protein